MAETTWREITLEEARQLKKGDRLRVTERYRSTGNALQGRTYVYDGHVDKLIEGSLDVVAFIEKGIAWLMSGADDLLESVTLEVPEPVYEHGEPYWLHFGSGRRPYWRVEGGWSQTPDEELLTLSDEALVRLKVTVGTRLVITEATS